jgi:uncharacterized protein YbjT (DUF2867 family)
MKILICGASGFIGRALSASLTEAGHEVIGGGRGPTSQAQGQLQIDYRRDLRVEDWLPRLGGIDVVINAVGILRERGDTSFEALHVLAPIALFEAATRSGVKKIIQISALGADAYAQSAYHRSKKQADDFLASLPIAWTIVQPSLVYGPGGMSAKLFNMLSALPFILLPGRGAQCVQPIHIDDLCAAFVRLVDAKNANRQIIALVGARALSLRELLASLRAQMKLPTTPAIPIPMPLVRLGASLAGLLPHSLLDPATLAMLERGNTAPADATSALLEREPRPVDEFIDPAWAGANADVARLNGLLPILRLSVALVWIITGILCFGIFPPVESYALLARVGIGPPFNTWLLYGAATLDVLMGVGILLARPRWRWRLQIAIVVVYTAIISVFLPEFWLHPFGPILKNIPLLAVLLLLHEFENRS